MAKTKDNLTAADFENYGMSVCPTIQQLSELNSDDIEILIYVDDIIGLTPTVSTTFYKSEIYWTLSPDNTNWYIYRGQAWQEVTLDNFVDLEFSTEEVNSIPQSALYIFKKGIYLKACLIINDNERCGISDFYVNNLTSFVTGQELIYSGDDLSLNTEMWLTIENLNIDYNTPEGTDIRLLFSSDNKVSWKTISSGIWRTVNLNNAFKDGISVKDVQNITLEQWRQLFPSSNLDVAVALRSDNSAVTPKIRSLIFSRTEYEENTESNIITILTPNEVYEHKVIGDDYKYKDEQTEGIGFDDRNTRNYWYTSPNKIHLRVYQVGTLVGSKNSQYYACKIRNTFKNLDCNISLTCRIPQGTAEIKEYMAGGNYGILPDANLEQERTKVEFFKNQQPITKSEYPMNFVLLAGGERLFYFKITPTLSSSGRVFAEIVATYTQYIGN